MKTPISYYGGKQKLISKILPLLPEHTLYTEPFIGGGAVYCLVCFLSFKIFCLILDG